jgi:DNA-directed RNA polymerase subunit M/transcription elongation factor TFIIS
MSDRDFKEINCQFCGVAFGVFTVDITEEGKNITCPSCHKNLFIQKSQFEKFFEYSMHCPKCGELQKTAQACIYCNVIISKFLKYKGLKSAWDTLSQRFIAKPATEKTGSLNTVQDLIIKCPYCGFSKKLSKGECPDYMTRIRCPGCNNSFDIVNWMNMTNE